MAITLLVTDKNLTVQGDPLDGWTDLSVDLNFNQPASGTVTLPAWPEIMAQLRPGNRLVVIRDGSIWCAGPMETPQSFAWDLDANAEPGTVTCSFSDDLARIAGYVTYPSPASAFSAQPADTTARTISATNAETIIRTLVNENCGPGAITARRIEQLVLDSVAGVGTSTSISTRLEALLDVCRTVASKDGLGFRTRQVGTQIKFGVYLPQDRSATCRFSAALGNLRSVSYALVAPLATAELVQGGDTSTATGVYVEVDSGAATDWYRVEKLQDQSGVADDLDGELTQAGNAALADDNPQSSLSTVTVDTDALKAGRDFFLGDKVTVALPTGLEVQDVVRTISLAATPDEGEVVTSVVGNQDQSTVSTTLKTVRELARRLGRLETRR
jgi:hypothetical protein